MSNRDSRPAQWTVALLLVMLLASAFRSSAQPVPAPEANDKLLRYIVELRPDLARLPGSPEKKEPKLSEFGGREIARWANRRVVELPRQALEALSRHKAVWFLARLNDGTATDAPKYIFNPDIGADARFEPGTEATTTPPKWDSGSYEYDGSGNIKSIGAGSASTDTFTYDRAGRLVSSVTAGASATYVYDSFGNQIERRYGTDTVTTNTHPTTNRLQNVVYDMAGNQLTTAGETESRTFDAANMLVTRTTQVHYSSLTDRYIYTADDERIGERHASDWRWTIRDVEGRPLSWFDSGGSLRFWSWQRDAYYREGVLVAGYRSAYGLRFYHRDHLGSTRLITNASKQKISAHDFYPFGREKTRFNQELTDWNMTGLDPLKYTGHERDFVNTYDADRHDYLDYMHARYYSPAWGRFLSVDPAIGLPSKPQSWNRYTYVQNQPINFKDPTGAYRTDFHYDLTRIIAVAAGYSVNDATTIAAMTELPDHDGRNPESVANHGARVAYHFPSQARLHSMYVDAAASSGFYEIGTYLHALQDSFSHRGYGPLIGHIGPLLKGALIDGANGAMGLGIPGSMGSGFVEAHTVDTTSARPGVAMDAARATYNALVKFHGGNAKVSFSAISLSVQGYLAADEHSVLRKFYEDRLKKQLGIK